MRLILGTKKASRSRQVLFKVRDHSGSYAIALFSFFYAVQAGPSNAAINYLMKVTNKSLIRPLGEKCQLNYQN